MAGSWTRAGLAFLLLTSAACARDDSGSEAANEGEAVVNAAPPVASNSSIEAGNAATGEQPAPAKAEGSILAWSRPAAGSTVRAPVNELVLHFSPPARLGEVTVRGPEGAMPMMVTAVGEVEHYSLPLSALGPGRYTVDWKASARGVDYSGSFGFGVR